jgi:hypothetical protein
MVDAHYSQYTLVALVVDSEGAKGPAVDLLPGPQDANGPFEWLGCETLDEIEYRRRERARRPGIALCKIGHRRFEIVGRLGRPNDLQD